MPHSLRARLSGLRYKKIISNKDYDRLCKALDNENVLDAIRAEIEQYNLRPSHYPCDMISIAVVLQIIDKYKTKPKDIEA